MEIITTSNYFRIVFPFNPRIVTAVKNLPERRFLPNDKAWLVPSKYRREVEVFAHRFGFNWGVATPEPEKSFDIPSLPDLTMEIPLKITMREYQRGGVAYNLLHKKVIIGDDMGLGKTLQAIAAIIGADMLFQNGQGSPSFPCLVICPSSVKLNWQDKWQEYTGRNFTMILDDANRKNWHLYLESNMAKVLIVNYESLKKYFVHSIDKGGAKKLRLNHVKFNENIRVFNSIIIDEIHKAKDSSTQQAKFCKGISTGKNFIFGLTGTPVINKPKDLISQLGIIEQMDRFGGYNEFTRRFCAGEKEASNLKELNYLLNKHCFYRRSKQEVAKELPPKTRQVIHCEITNQKEYQDAEENLITYLREYKNATDEKIQKAMAGQVMVQIGVLKNISARGKIKDVTEFIDDTIENGEKIVLFVHLKEVAHAFREHYRNCATITGDDNLNERQESIRRFKADPKCMLIVCSIKAAGTGIDGLQASSSTVAFIELPWHAADCDQAEDRLNRIGQTKSVNCLYFLGKNTIDNHIYEIIQTKREISDTVTGNTDEVKVDFVNEIANLFNKKV